ncbi:MAG TPA: vitamin K epoxide reductase family protein [Candidatus Limnocylindrales bacterium]
MEVLAVVTLWFLVFGLVSAVVANARAREPLTWFVVGGIAGPLALLAVLVLRPGTGVEPANRYVAAVRHPAALLAVLDVVGLTIASYLSTVELGGGLPSCGPLRGCEQVAQSQYARVAGVPVAVGGVVLSLVLLTLAIAWWRTGSPALLAAHYGLSLAGVMFEGYFTYLELFVIGYVCVWCASYGMSLVARFLVALWVWTHRERYAPG